MAVKNSRRARRRSEASPTKGDLREAQILDAVEKLLQKIPYLELTMEDIARKTKLSRSSLYFYFESKEEVLSALFDRMHALRMNTIPQFDPSDTSERSVIEEKVINTAMQNWREHTATLRTFFEVAMVSPEFGAKWRAGVEEAIDASVKFLEAERAAGRIAPGPPEARSLVSTLVWAMEYVIYQLFCREHSRADEDELIETIKFMAERTIIRSKN